MAKFDRSVFDILMKEYSDDNNDWNYEVFKTAIDKWRELQHLADDEWDCDAMRGLYALIQDTGVDALTFLEREDGFEFVGLYTSEADFAEETVSYRLGSLSLPDWLVIDFEETATELADTDGYYYVNTESGCYVFLVY